jgi:hypothetical protein
MAAKRRKKVYVPPTGRKPGVQNEGESDWRYYAYLCESMRTWIPYADEPETMGWHDPQESISKERMEKRHVEESYCSEALEAFATLLDTWRFPETSDQAAYLIRARLEWAEATCLCLDKMPLSKNSTWLFPPRNLETLKDVLRWLVADFYDKFPVFPKKWWDGSSFERYYE